MSLEVVYTKVSSQQEAYEAVKSAVTPDLIAKFQVKAKIDYCNDHIKAKGKGFELLMNFNEQACLVELDLSLLLKPLRKKILEGIHKQLQRVI